MPFLDAWGCSQGRRPKQLVPRLYDCLPLRTSYTADTHGTYLAVLNFLDPLPAISSPRVLGQLDRSVARLRLDNVRRHPWRLQGSPMVSLGGHAILVVLVLSSCVEGRGG